MINWISVDERMPADNGEDFLIIDMDAGVRGMCAPGCTVRWAGYTPDGEIADCALANPQFTHWAELNLPDGTPDEQKEEGKPVEVFY